MWESKEDFRNSQLALDVTTFPLWSMSYYTHWESGMNSLGLIVMTMSPSSGTTFGMVNDEAPLTASVSTFCF